MAKKEYMLRIYLRQEDEDGDYWYAVHSSSRHAEVAVMNNPSIRGLTNKLMTFKTVEDAEALMNSGSLPNMGGVWEVVSKWVPKPVSGAQRSLSAQYCRKKRQLAGAAAILKMLCQASISKDKINWVLEVESGRLDIKYRQELGRIKGEEK